MEPIEETLLVSVVMAVYNGEGFVEEAIASLRAQTYAPIEFVIVDDGSTDDTNAILRRHAAADSRFRVIEQANAGLTRALVAGVRHARGNLIARMDADDLSMPTRIAKQVALLRRAPHAAAATCRIYFDHPDGKTTNGRPLGNLALMPWFLIFYNKLASHGQMMFRRDAYDRAGGYDPDVRYAQDHDLWPRLLREGALVTSEEWLYRYRVTHSSSITKNSSSGQLDCSIRVTLREYERLCGVAIDRADAILARDFWVAHDDRLGGRDGVKRVRGMLRRAYDALAASASVDERDLGELRAMIADRWLTWIERARIEQPGTMLAAGREAVRWAPGLAPRVAAALARKAARGVRRTLRHAA